MKCAEQLTQVFRLVFDNEDLTITPETTPNDIDGWDSMAHLNLLAAVQTHFKIKFASKELGALRTVGDLGELIDSKLG